MEPTELLAEDHSTGTTGKIPRADNRPELHPKGLAEVARGRAQARASVGQRPTSPCCAKKR